MTNPPPHESAEGLLPEEVELAPLPQEALRERPGYRLWHFVEGWLDTACGPAPVVSTRLQGLDRWGAIKDRLGLEHPMERVTPGLYAVGRAGRGSPILVTASSKLSFDALRSELESLDAWILVLETRGLSVWSAAAAGSFCAEELIGRIQRCAIASLVDHRTLILPQLAAAGVAAHLVESATGFAVVYGPVRAADLRTFLAGGLQASPAMRRITFHLRERLLQVPSTLLLHLRSTLAAILLFVFLSGIGPGLFSPAAAWHRGGAAALAWLAGLVAGTVLTPILLPWLPTRTFAEKGALVGLGMAAGGLACLGASLGWMEILALLVAIPLFSSWWALMFSGATPFTACTRVEAEMRRTLPLQAGWAMLTLVLWVGSAFFAEPR